LPIRQTELVPLDALITGRIATLAGDAGFGWVEALGIRDGRVAFAGTEVDLETRADPHTERITLEPDEVAIPGLTDAHLHLAHTAVAARQVNLTDARTIEEGLALIRAAHARLTDADAWLEGHGWDSDRWGRWPTATDLEPAAPGRRCLLWAHDHHALLASRAALRDAGVDRSSSDPAGGVIGRDDDGEPNGVLFEEAAGLVADLVPAISVEELETGLVAVGRELVALGVVAVHDPGGLVPEPNLDWSFPAYTHLSETGRLPVRAHVAMRDDSLAAAIDRGLRSGEPLGGGTDPRARVGWLKCFADGSLGSRTAALLEEIVPEPDRPLPPERRRGVWVTEPGALADLAERAAAAGIATQIHAIGDAAVRAALEVLAPTAPRVPLMPRLEHVQLLDPADRGSFVAAAIAASVQPVHLGSDAAQARKLWGDRAERNGYTWASIAATGAVMPFGTDAPVEPIDPWPGIALAVTRVDPSWPAGTPAYGPHEALSLDRALRAACVDPAVSARESDRGRLTVGQRADVVVLPAAALREPVQPGGALATARPSIVVMDGRVVFEA
jgi:predicted amidohydrolase YtcJ